MFLLNINKMNNKLTLTRYLYFADEVALSLLDCLIEQRDLNEALFWVDELYSSGFVKDIWLLLWKIYFDFYAITNPLFMKKLSKIWKTSKKIEDVLYVVKNLFYLVPCYQVFLFRIKKFKKPLTVYLPSSLTKKDRILKAIKYRHIGNLRYLIDGYDFADTDFIKQYFTTQENSKFRFFDYPNELQENFISYYILSHMELGLSEVIKSKYIGRKLVSREKMESSNLAKDDVVGYSRYKVLKDKRYFKISNKIGCFNKNRDDVIVFEKRLLDLNSIYWYYWLYFTQNTPLWSDRIKEYGGTYNSKNFTVCFPDDDKFENFHEKFDLEPDEQTSECQNKSLIEIPEINISDWIREKFGVEVDAKCDMVDYKN